jgi:hypothetical protein
MISTLKGNLSFYEDNILVEIFNEITNHILNNNPHRPIKINYAFPKLVNAKGENEDSELYLLSIGDEGQEIAAVKKEDVEELMARIIKLISDSDLQALVLKIHKLINDLKINKNRNDYFTKIDILYESIFFRNGELLDEKRMSS